MNKVFFAVIALMAIMILAGYIVLKSFVWMLPVAVLLGASGGYMYLRLTYGAERANRIFRLR